MGHDAKVFAPFHRNRHILDIPKSALSGRFLDRYPRKTTRILLEVNRLLATKAIDKSGNTISKSEFSRGCPE
jgi:hypothetical protein